MAGCSSCDGRLYMKSRQIMGDCEVVFVSNTDTRVYQSANDSGGLAWMLHFLGGTYEQQGGVERRLLNSFLGED
jgi:hypothetical protein